MYISKLLQFTNESDDSIAWYRSALTSRARSIQGCRMGKLLNRDSTSKSSSSSKYARDCYVLEMFIQGDKSQIEEVFRKEDQTKPSVSESSNDSSYINIIELRVCVQSLMERVNALEKSERNNEKLIKSLQSQNANLRSQYSNLLP